MIRRFDGEGEKPKPVTEIVVTSLGDPTKTETMKWEGNETGNQFLSYSFNFPFLWNNYCIEDHFLFTLSII